MPQSDHSDKCHKRNKLLLPKLMDIHLVAYSAVFVQMFPYWQTAGSLSLFAAAWCPEISQPG